MRLRGPWVGFSLVAICLIWEGGVGARPADVERVDAVFEAVDRAVYDHPIHASTPPDLLQEFNEWLGGLCVASAREMGLSDELGIPSRRFNSQLADYVAAQVNAAWQASNKAERFSRLVALMREIGNRSTAEALIARYVGVQPVGSYLDAAYGPPVEAEALPRASSQISVTSSASDLAILIEETQVAGEYGGAGTGNHLLDAGEWARLRLVVENRSDRPYFSSSAWAVPDSDCVWTNPSKEYRLPEMEQDGGQAWLSFWVYLAEACDGDYEVVVSVEDTHRAATRPQKTRLRLDPVRAVEFDLTHTFFDTDVPGFSDGSDAPGLEPSMRFELGTGVRVDGGAARAARVKYGVVEGLQGLFAQQFHRNVDQIRVAFNRFEAGDDLDIEIVGEAPFEQELRRYGYAQQSWYSSEDGGVIWFAVDVELDLASPDPPTEVVEEEVVEEVPVLTLQHIDYLGALVKKHIRLVTRPATPEISGALDATDGYEVIFDDSAFMEELAVLLRPTEETTEPGPGRPDTLSYRYRRYIPLDLPAVVAAAPPPPPPPPPAPVEYVPEPEPFVEAEPVKWGLYVGLGGGIGWVRADRTFNSGVNGTVIPPGVYGRVLGGVGVFRWGLEVAYNYVNTENWELSQTDVLTGPAAALPAGGAVLIEPRLFFGGQNRTVPSLLPTSAISDHQRRSFAFEIGCALRFRIIDQIGFVVDPAYVISAAGPWGPSREYQYLGGHLRLVAGISFGKHGW